MQKWSILTSIIIVSLVIAILLPGCNLLKKSSSSATGTSDPSEPMTSSWSMTRVSYEPPFPQTIPVFLVDQVFPKTPTWKITLSGGQLTVTYDGRATWYNPMGFTVKTNAVTVTENADKKGAKFKGGGVISAAKLPGAMSLLGTLTGGMEDINIGYTDTINVSMTSDTQISASISYTADGTYVGGKGKDRIIYSGQLKYTGTKK